MHVPPPSLPPSLPPDPSSSTTALDISLVTSVLILSLLLQHVLKSQQLLTGSGACMLLGGVFNGCLFAFSKLDILSGHISISNPTNQITHNVIYFGLLPPIILEAGFHLRKRQFFKNFGTILLLAVIGTLIALISTGLLVYCFSLPQVGLLWTHFSVAQAMVFGSLISSTDPVATLGILKHVNAMPLLNDLIFGESALNDALSVALFDVFLRAVFRGEGRSDGGGGGGGGWPPPRWWEHSPPPPPPEPDSGMVVSIVVGDVLRTILGSIVLGVGFALLSALVTKKLRGAQRDRRTHASLELALLLLFALLAFSASERAGLSGIMALFFCAVGMRHYTLYNTSKASQRSARVLLTTLSETSEACLATLLGVAFVDYLVKALDDDGGFHRLLSPASFGFDRLLSSEDSGAATAADATHMRHHHAGAPVVWDVPFLALGLPILLLSRALNVFPLAFIANLCRPPEQRISLRMQIVIWFSGMRGAVSFTLAITLPGAGALHGGSPDATWAVPMVTTTLGMIVATNLLLAPLTGPLIRSLDLQADDVRRASTSSGSMRGSESGNRTLNALRVSLSADGATSLLPPGGCHDGRATASGDAEAAAANALRWQGSAPQLDHARMRASAIHRAWKLLDETYMKPTFGGRQTVSRCRSGGGHARGDHQEPQAPEDGPAERADEDSSSDEGGND